MEITTKEASQRLEVNQARVRALIASGALRAKMVGQQWLIDADSLDRQASLIAGQATGRSMSTRTAWALAAMLDDQKSRILNAAERHRVRKRLKAGHVGAAVAQRWLSHRFDRVAKYRVGERDIDRILGEDGVVITGVSAIAAYELGLGTGSSGDAYVNNSVRDRLVRDFALIPSRTGNMTLRTVSGGWHLATATTIDERRVAPRLIVGVDLADDTDARTSSAGRVLIETALCAERQPTIQ